jgi:hypothetical protein
MNRQKDIQLDILYIHIHTHPQTYPSIHPPIYHFVSMYLPTLQYLSPFIRICPHIRQCMLPSNYLSCLHYQRSCTPHSSDNGQCTLLYLCTTVKTSTLHFCSQYCSALPQTIQCPFHVAAAHHISNLRHFAMHSTRQKFQPCRTYFNS